VRGVRMSRVWRSSMFLEHSIRNCRSAPSQHHFADRDSSGTPPASIIYPYFRSGSSRSSIQAGSPVRVKSCWGGLVNAAPFYSKQVLKFHALPDSLAKKHVEASECCLIHVEKPLSDQKGVYINGNVRVAYSATAYTAVNPANRKWPSTWQRVTGIWWNRWARLAGLPGSDVAR
jgi:hypothetical protein